MEHVLVNCLFVVNFESNQQPKLHTCNDCVMTQSHTLKSDIVN